jgi:hypothetical protein
MKLEVFADSDSVAKSGCRFCRRQSIEWRPLVELILVDTKRADLRIESRCRQAESSGSAPWSINSTTRLPQQCFDLSFSIRSEASRDWRCRH